MGFICPKCKKDFGTNKEWFEDHMYAHRYLERDFPRPTIITRESKIATLSNIKKAISSDKIRVYENSNGEIVFIDTKTGSEYITMPYYDMDGETRTLEYTP